MNTIWDDDYQEYDGEDNMTCTRCGQRGLTWIDTGVRFLLFDEHGKKHVCSNAKLLGANAFPDLT